MRYVSVVLLILAVMTLGPSEVEAHQPRLVTDDGLVEITDPQLSQAFYATLEGSPHLYRVAVTGEQPLYVSILVPALPTKRSDFVLELTPVAAPETTLARLDGQNHSWTPFFEPFGGDRYDEGPEADWQLPAGEYLIRVANPDNAGKYVLSVGRQERFTPREVMQTIVRLPHVKRFFDKSPWTAYLNLVGVFMLATVAALGLGLAALVRRLLSLWRGRIT